MSTRAGTSLCRCHRRGRPPHGASLHYTFVGVGASKERAANGEHPVTRGAHADHCAVVPHLIHAGAQARARVGVRTCA